MGDAGGTVTVLVPAVLAQHTGDRRELTVQVPGTTTVAELLDVLARDYPIFGRRVRNEAGAIRRYVNCYLDGEDIRGLDGTGTRVQAGQQLLLIQSVAGG
ncbi:MoaD/ThiS family protein [Arthrobacter sp. I2-34]|uniref:MoaD/ThiS family protein n=1 Tax=Arthrobacter hankyongi TaxID=2904801 RepID=A0ABS9L5J4_9MICC|nr:MoaD/ThiS family protein [Arthrobacter hankyongi]MCG2621891.1 MoaD/ThiS family protein [Arthrobacter hankyongi]